MTFLVASHWQLILACQEDLRNDLEKNYNFPLEKLLQVHLENTIPFFKAKSASLPKTTTSIQVFLQAAAHSTR